VNDSAETAGEIVETKKRVCAAYNVTPGRVSQWIDEGKITAAALDGEGRSARIKVRVALAQLNRSLDIDQRRGSRYHSARPCNLLRGEFRKVRAKMAEAVRRRAAGNGCVRVT
jgi:hypothetical protein